MNRTASFRYTLFLASAAGLGGLLFGFDIGIITGAGPFLKKHFGLNDLSLGWAFSSLLFGCVIGSAVAGRLSETHGRRRILLLVAVLFAVTSLASGMAFTFPEFIVARFLGGLAVGGASILSPMYVAEVSPPTLRGRMGTLYQMSIVTGILVSYCINYVLRDSGPENWRWMFATGIVPSIAFFVVLLLAPETPRYLLKVRREVEALSILERISGSERAALELSEIRASFRDRSGLLRDLLQPGIRRATTIAFCLAILVHVSGINTIIDYAPAIFRSAGLNIDQALLSTFANGLIEFLFTIVSFWVIDRWGRKPLYVVGSLIMTLCLVLLAVAAGTKHFHGTIVLLLILTYLASFASCIGPVFWTLIPELFPNRVRSIGMTIPVLTQWIANAVVVLFFPIAFSHVGKVVTFGFLALMALVQALFTFGFVPETKNKSLEEIGEFWSIPAERDSAPAVQ